MFETKYAREPINFRLFALNSLKKFWILPLVTFMCSILVGGVYYLNNVVFGEGHQYRATTIYYVTYEEDGAGEEYDYYNYFTWSEIVHTDEFVDGIYNAFGGEVSKEYILEKMSANLESDYRYLYTKSVSSTKEKAVELENEMAKLMVGYADKRKEIKTIEVIDEADILEIEDVSLIFEKRAFIVGAVIGFLATIIFSIYYACVDTSVYLPATLEKRYGIPTLGAPSMEEFAANCKHFLGDKKSIAVISVDGEASQKTEEDRNILQPLYEGEEIKALKERLGSEVEIVKLSTPFDDKNQEKDSHVLEDGMNNADAVVISVKAAGHNGKRVERILEQLDRTGIKVTAFMLVGEDKKLIRDYYK